jgi:hypothetical protein
MKSLTLISTVTLCLAVFGCSTAANAPTDSAGGETSAGGSGETAGTGTTVSGGATGSSGSTNVAGTTSGGGTSEGGTGGVVEMGGAPAGGNAGATSAGAGAGGAGGGAAGGGPIDPTNFSGGWDGALIEFPCGAAAKNDGYDCPQPPATQCKNYDQKANPVVSTIPPGNGVPDSWTMGGTAGTVYDLTFHLRGVVEVTSYDGNGVRAAGNTSVLTTPRNLFQSGGTVQVNGDPSFDYNTYELDVTPPVSGAPNVYFLNSVTTGQNPHASNSPTTHLTFDIDYNATIKVPGGGKVTMKVTDSNCTQVQNCGNTSGNTCANPRTVSLSGSTPAAPAFPQPFASGTDYGQWVFFDVTAVTVAQ